MKHAAWIIALGLVAAGAGAGWAADPPAIIKERQAVMKEQGKDVGAVKAFIEGKGELAAAQAGADDLLKTIPKIPNLFPQKTSMAEYPGKVTGAKPEIWADWAKFTAAQKTALEKAQVLDAALKSGDKAKIEAAFGDMGKNGCGGCHTAFREKI